MKLIIYSPPTTALRSFLVEEAFLHSWRACQILYQTILMRRTATAQPDVFASMGRV